jgi:hypothetical protein
VQVDAKIPLTLANDLWKYPDGLEQLKADVQRNPVAVRNWLFEWMPFEDGELVEGVFASIKVCDAVMRCATKH